MWNHKLKAADQKFAVNIPLPVNTTATGATALQTRKHGGNLAVTIDALTPATLPTGAALTVKIQDSDDNVTFTDVVTHSITFPAAKAFAVGDLLARIPLVEETKRWTRVVVGTTTATGATGNIDVFLEYLAS